MKLAPRHLRERLHALLHLDDAPWRIALALAVGVFIGCTPFWFFQTGLALLIAWMFRLNKAATVTGAWLNLPWFAPFVYGAALKVGEVVLPGRLVPPHMVARLLGRHDAFDWRTALAMLRETSLALLVGTTVVGGVAAVVTYVVAIRLISRRGPAGGAASPGQRHAA
jgi:uncharacterized protein (DUF2062 family)